MSISNLTIYIKKQISIKFFAVSFIGFFVLFFLTDSLLYGIIDNKIHLDGVSRITAVFHSIICVVVASQYLRGKVTEDSWRRLISFSLAYLLYDNICYSYYYFFGNGLPPVEIGALILDNYLHHLLFAIFLLIPTKIYSKQVAQGLLSELSNPFVYACWFMYVLGNRDTLYFKIIAIVGLAVYFIFRIVNFSYILNNAIKNNDSKAKTKAKIFLILILTVINYYWFFKLCRIFLGF